MYRFKDLSISEVLAIAKWSDSKIGRKIDMQDYYESYLNDCFPLKGPDKCVGMAVYNEDKSLFGLFEYYATENGFEIGLAINPKYRGKGYGYTFVEEGVLYGQHLFPKGNIIDLEVKKRNTPAIKIYEKLGFVRVSETKYHYKMNRLYL